MDVHRGRINSRDIGMGLLLQLWRVPELSANATFSGCFKSGNLKYVLGFMLATNDSNARAAIGTTALALEYCCLLVLFNVYRRYPEYILPCTRAAVGLCVVSLLAASFATSVGQLILFQVCLSNF